MYLGSEAIYAGHLNMTKFMLIKLIEKEPKVIIYAIKMGMYAACYQNYENIIDILIEFKTGDTKMYYNSGLSGACTATNHHIMRKMINLGATKCRCGNRHY